MSGLNGISHNASVNKILPNPVQRTVNVDASAKPNASDRADRVELSGAHAMLQTLKTNDIRMDKVAEIKAQIAAGTYETDDKLNIAADRLLDDLA